MARRTVGSTGSFLLTAHFYRRSVTTKSHGSVTDVLMYYRTVTDVLRHNTVTFRRSRFSVVYALLRSLMNFES